MTSKTWIIFGTVVLALFGGIIYLSTNKQRIDVSQVDAMKPVSASKQSGNIGDHVYGNKDAKIVLIEYGDYQCPGCESAYQPLKNVTEKYKDHVAFVFRNFPLTSIHPNARAAAAAAEAAGLQGKYWEMHNLLYEDQAAWKDADTSNRGAIFEGYAKQLGLNVKQYSDDLKNKTDVITAKIDYDRALGGKVGVSSTPTLYLNGKVIDKYVKDGKLVPQSNDASPVWANEESFDTLIMQPALKEAGIDISKLK